MDRHTADLGSWDVNLAAGKVHIDAYMQLPAPLGSGLL
jgi:hypothetical protein